MVKLVTSDTRDTSKIRFVTKLIIFSILFESLFEF